MGRMRRDMGRMRRGIWAECAVAYGRDGSSESRKKSEKKRKTTPQGNRDEQHGACDHRDRVHLGEAFEELLA